MISSWLRCEMTVVVILGIFTLFFFPAPRGTYSVVHGPATAFQAARSSARVHALIAQGALHRVRDPLPSLLVVLALVTVSKTECHALGLPEYGSVLRC